MSAPQFVEILDWVFLVAAFIVILLQQSARNAASALTYSRVFWVLLAACFVTNGIQSESWWQWLWYAAAAASLATALFVRVPRVHAD